MGGKSQPQMPQAILTSGKGVEEEATTSQSLLGGKKYT